MAIILWNCSLIALSFFIGRKVISKHINTLATISIDSSCVGFKFLLPRWGNDIWWHLVTTWIFEITIWKVCSTFWKGNSRIAIYRVIRTSKVFHTNQKSALPHQHKYPYTKSKFHFQLTSVISGNKPQPYSKEVISNNLKYLELLQK